jgi:hypothetical protein
MVSATQRMRPSRAFLLSLTLVVLAGCCSTGQTRPHISGRLSSQDIADVQTLVRRTSTKPILRIEEAGQRVEAYTGTREGGGIVYLFRRNQAGRLEGCGSGWWD